jgi:serine/threonine protein kinase
MTLPTGRKLGPYEITGVIGTGGMGEVYRARDPRLGREVAIKVLPERVSAHPDALSRFEREAKAVAALSHPNILAIHDIGVEDGTAYSVTELLEGETLRERMGGSPLPVRKLQDYAVQIARGLAAAHEKGVTHRDLKPENIFITHDGRAKILDFGLAKVELSPEAELTSSPTAEAGTLPGTVMGTMGYMSPEQVRGQPVDARSDIFSLGSVLYEMATGRRAFTRETPADTMSAILKEDPPGLSGTGIEIPPTLQRIIEHCLEKGPAERFQSARDLAFHLEAVGTTSSASSMDVAPISSARERPLLRTATVFAAGLALGAALGAVVALRFSAPGESSPPVVRYLSYSGRDSQPSTSSDGRLIAYASVREGSSQIWLKQFPSGDEVALTPGPNDVAPRISPDGTQVLFTRSEEGHVSILKVPILGGEPRKVVDDGYGGDWSPDGSRVVFLRDIRDDRGISTVLATADASGEGSREITTMDLASLLTPRWSPDGKTIAVVKTGSENAPQVLLLVPLDGGEVQTITPPPPRGRLSAPAWIGRSEGLFFAQSGSIAVSGTDEGSSRLILQDLASGRQSIKMWIPQTINGLDLMGDGMVVMGVSSNRQTLMEVRIDAADGEAKGHRITRGNSTDRQPTFSRDGKWLLFTSNRGGNLDLWKMEVATGAIRRITEDRADDWDPAFTADGERILWSSNRGGHFEIWVCDADGTGARQLTQDGLDAENPTATADAEWVIYNSGNPAHPGIWKIRPDGTDASLVVAGSWSTPDTSPDGAFIVFRTSGDSRLVYTARIEDGAILGDPTRATGNNFNGRPRWMPDGRQIVFTDSDGTGARGLTVRDFHPERGMTGSSRKLLPFVMEEPPESFGISPDGAHIVYSAADWMDSLMLAEGVTGVLAATAGP